MAVSVSISFDEQTGRAELDGEEVVSLTMQAGVCRAVFRDGATKVFGQATGQAEQAKAAFVGGTYFQAKGVL